MDKASCVNLAECFFFPTFSWLAVMWSVVMIMLIFEENIRLRLYVVVILFYILHKVCGFVVRG